MQLRALFYADWRALVNDGRRIARSRGRSTVWLFYAAVLGFFFWSRISMRARFGAVSEPADVARVDYFMCALLVTLALALASGRGAIGIFRSRTEARFIIGSPVAAPLAIAYLQARESLAQGWRVVFSFIYLIFIFGPRQLSAIAILADLTLIVAIIAAGSAVVVPRRLLPRPAAIACTVVGVPLALVALAPALRDAVVQLPLPLPAPIVTGILAYVPAWHPGRVLLEPNPLWLLAVFAIAGAAIAVSASAGRDAYPELYALSVARIDRLERLRQRRGGRTSPSPARRRESTRIPAPAGVLAFVWKSVVEFERRTSPRFIAIGAGLWGLAGFAAGRLVSAGREALFTALLAVVVNIMLVVGITATHAIAAEIRRPLFWLAREPLFERLCALGLARIWRTIVTLELIAVGFALGGGALIDSLVLATGLPALVALLAAIGFTAFALFPSTADLRGPIAVLRLGISVVLVAPPFVLFIVGATVFDAAPIGLGVATVLALIEAGALIGLAAWRLDGHVDRIAA